MPCTTSTRSDPSPSEIAARLLRSGARAGKVANPGTGPDTCPAHPSSKTRLHSMLTAIMRPVSAFFTLTAPPNAAVGQGVVHEVHRPPLVRPQRHRHHDPRSRRKLLPLPGPDRELLLAIEPADAFVVADSAF